MADRDVIYAKLADEFKFDQHKSVAAWIRDMRSDLTIAFQAASAATELNWIQSVASRAVGCMARHGCYWRETEGKNEYGSYRGPAIFKMPVDHWEVFRCIDGERTYQDNLPAERSASVATGSTHDIDGYLLMLDHYIREATDDWNKNNDNAEALKTIRKIAAIAVSCLEKWL